MTGSARRVGVDLVPACGLGLVEVPRPQCELCGARKRGRPPVRHRAAMRAAQTVLFEEPYFCPRCRADEEEEDEAAGAA